MMVVVMRARQKCDEAWVEWPESDSRQIKKEARTVARGKTECTRSKGCLWVARSLENGTMQLVTGLSSGRGESYSWGDGDVEFRMREPWREEKRRERERAERRGEESERRRSREERGERRCGAKQPRERKMNAVYKVDIGERAWTALTM